MRGAVGNSTMMINELDWVRNAMNSAFNSI